MNLAILGLAGLLIGSTTVSAQEFSCGNSQGRAIRDP